MVSVWQGMMACGIYGVGCVGVRDMQDAVCVACGV